MEPSGSEPNRPSLIRYPLMRGFLAALCTAGFSLLLLASFNFVDPVGLPWTFPIILFCAWFASQLQERMRTMAEITRSS